MAVKVPGAKPATKDQGWADKMRGKLIDKAAQGGGNTGAEWVPPFGTSKIRILPPIGDGDLFYHTHTFHFIPESGQSANKGKFLWTRKQFQTDAKGGTKRCPICEAVDQWYTIGRKDDDKELLQAAGQLKLKRNFFFNIILYTDEGPVFKIMRDSSNEGKLTRVICGIMGIPFWRDVEDNWVDKNSTNIDPERDYFDLVDVEGGHDLKIVKEKTGSNNWDVSYEKSFAVKTPRALDEEETVLLDSRVELKTYIAYETDFDKVKAVLDAFIGDDGGAAAEPEAKPKAKAAVADEDEDEAPAPKKGKPAPAKSKTQADDDADIDAVLADIPDAEE